MSRALRSRGMRWSVRSSIFISWVWNCAGRPAIHSFPTRRSSDLPDRVLRISAKTGEGVEHVLDALSRLRDRKSTRLNSSHQIISYAVFCLKKKKKAPKRRMKVCDDRVCANYTTSHDTAPTSDSPY